MVGCDHEKGAAQIHGIIKQLIMDHNTNRRESTETGGGDDAILESDILDNSMSRELEVSVDEIEKPPEGHETE
jgi:hypothetical protein